jgi:hypothetical protein
LDAGYESASPAQIAYANSLFDRLEADHAAAKEKQAAIESDPRYQLSKRIAGEIEHGGRLDRLSMEQLRQVADWMQLGFK